MLLSFYIRREILIRLKQDIPFRVGLALALGVTERAVYDTIKKCMENALSNSSFTKKAALKYFEQHGYTEEEVLTEEIPAIHS